MRSDLPPLDWSGEVIQDPIWGNIQLSDLESELIHTSVFSRLRDIHQLGFVYLSYTGANHTRFEHCIGTMEAADRILNMVNFKKSKPPFSDWPKGQALTVDLLQPFGELRTFRQALRICALLHDIGHPPYSHTCENLLRESHDVLDNMAKTVKKKVGLNFTTKTLREQQLKRYLREDCKTLNEILTYQHGKKWEENPKALRDLGDHETYTKFIILCQNREIRDILEQWVIRTFATYNRRGVDKKRVKSILFAIAWLAAGKHPPEKVKLCEADARILHPIAPFIDGDLDVDKIDYVQRDNYHCGLPYELDWRGVRDSIYIERKENEPEKFQLTFSNDALFFLTSIIFERFRFGYHLHNETWNAFLDRDIVRKLRVFLKQYDHTVYREPFNLFVKKILDMHTKWEDGELRFYLDDCQQRLLDSEYQPDNKNGLSKDWGPDFKSVITKNLPITKKQKSQRVTTVREDARIHIGFDDMSPPIRKMVHVLGQSGMRSDKEAKKCLDKIEKELDREGDKNLVVYFYKVKPMKFTTLLHGTDKGGGKQALKKILDNQIIRGVMNESLRQFGVCVLGTKDLPKPANVGEYMPPSCEQCPMEGPHFQLCIRNNSYEQKVLIGEIIRCYRNLCSKVCCGDNPKIIFSDFILKVLQQYEDKQNKEKLPHNKPLDSETLYSICSEVARALARDYKDHILPEDIIFGGAHFFPERAREDEKNKQVPYEFHQEVRTCVYLGLIDAERDIVERDFIYKPFRRTYKLSIWGNRYFEALKAHHEANPTMYGGYIDMLGRIEKVFQPDIEGKSKHYVNARLEIVKILSKWKEICENQCGKYEVSLKKSQRKKCETKQALPIKVEEISRPSKSSKISGKKVKK